MHMATEILDPKHENPSDQKTKYLSGRAEIDTSSPFNSVKEAANLFGGMALWKPFSHNPSEHVSQVDEHTVKLENDLRKTEIETLHILKELETTKSIAQLNLKLHKETNPSFDLSPSEAPVLTLLQLKQAKLNLTRSTNDISDIQSAIDFYNTEIDKHRTCLEETRQRLSSKTSKITSLEEELNEIILKLDLVKETETTRSKIEETKTKIKTAEKTKQEARASEAVINALLAKYNDQSTFMSTTLEEYESKVRESDMTQILEKIEEATKQVKISKRDLEEALSRVEVANRGKLVVEEELCKWRLENDQRRISFVHDFTKIDDLLEPVKSVEKLSKRKKFSFARISSLFTKHSNRKKKEQTANSMCPSI